MKLITDRHGGKSPCQCLQPNTIKLCNLQQNHKTQEPHLLYNILCNPVVKINALNTLSLPSYYQDGKRLREILNEHHNSGDKFKVIYSYCHFSGNT